MSNIISWFEIPTRDFKRAAHFYRKVFGFVIDEKHFNGVSHGVIKHPFAADKYIGGVLVENQDMDEIADGPVLFFDVNGKMEITLQRIVENGGEVVMKKTLIRNQRADGSNVIPQNMIDGKVGYHAYFLDVDGHRMGLYSNS